MTILYERPFGSDGLHIIRKEERNEQFMGKHMPYAALCLEVLALFYGIYFTKVLLQKRRGIQTRQIGRRKERALHTVELWMSAATLGVVIAQLLSVALGWSIKNTS